MKRRIKHNDLIPWFLEDHADLPASYVASCQRFFDELDKRQAAKYQDYINGENLQSALGWKGSSDQASSNKLQAPSLKKDTI